MHLQPSYYQKCQEPSGGRDVPKVRSATRKEETRCAFWQQPQHFREASHDHCRRARAVHELAISSSTARHHNEVQARLEEEQTVSASTWATLQLKPEQLHRVKEIFRSGRRWSHFNSNQHGISGGRTCRVKRTIDSMQRLTKELRNCLVEKGVLRKVKQMYSVAHSMFRVVCWTTPKTLAIGVRLTAPLWMATGPRQPRRDTISGHRVQRSDIQLHVRHFPIKCTCDKLFPEWLTELSRIWRSP